MKRFLLPLAVLLSVVAGGSVLAVDRCRSSSPDAPGRPRAGEAVARRVPLFLRPLRRSAPRPEHLREGHGGRAAAHGRGPAAAAEVRSRRPRGGGWRGHRAGRVPDQAVEDLYAAYVEQGEAGLAQALEAAVAIETADIARLESGIAGESASYADILQVYTSLLASSQRHLAAFVKVLGQTDPDGELVATDVQACGGRNGRW